MINLFLIIALSVTGFDIGRLSPAAATQPALQQQYSVSQLIELSRRNDRQQQNQNQNQNNGRERRLFKGKG